MRSPVTPILDVDSVTVSRGKTPILRDLTFRLAKGEVTAIRGSSGAGKTTLLAVLCGLLRADSGSIRLNSIPMDRLSDRRRSAIRLTNFGLVFQDDELLPELTLGENVSLPLRLSRAAGSKRRIRDTVRAELSRLGINDLADRLPSEVSGGQLQRAAIARAVIHGPSVVLADEPTASLDEVAARAAMRLLIETARDRGAAVVVVTHDDTVAGVCDRSLFLRDGVLRPESEYIERP